MTPAHVSKLGLKPLEEAPLLRLLKEVQVRLGFMAASFFRDWGHGSVALSCGSSRRCGWVWFPLAWRAGPCMCSSGSEGLWMLNG